MPELGTLGSERGALSNERPYRDRTVGAGRLFSCLHSGDDVFSDLFVLRDGAGGKEGLHRTARPTSRS